MMRQLGMNDVIDPVLALGIGLSGYTGLSLRDLVDN